MSQWKLPNKDLKNSIVKVFINKYNRLQISFGTVYDMQVALGYFALNRVDSLVQDFKLETKSIYLEKEISLSRFGYEIHESFKKMIID